MFNPRNSVKKKQENCGGPSKYICRVFLEHLPYQRSPSFFLTAGTTQFAARG
jgi:hypothetical protein